MHPPAGTGRGMHPPATGGASVSGTQAAGAVVGSATESSAHGLNRARSARPAASDSQPGSSAARVETSTFVPASAPAAVSTNGVPARATLPPGASDSGSWPSARNTNGRLEALDSTQAPFFHSKTAARTGVSPSPVGRSTLQ